MSQPTDIPPWQVARLFVGFLLVLATWPLLYVGLVLMMGNRDALSVLSNLNDTIGETLDE